MDVYRNEDKHQPVEDAWQNAVTDLVEDAPSTEHLMAVAVAILNYASQAIHDAQEANGEPCECGAIWAHLLSGKIAGALEAGPYVGFTPQMAGAIMKAVSVAMYITVPDVIVEMSRTLTPELMIGEDGEEILPPSFFLASEAGLAKQQEEDPETVERLIAARNEWRMAQALNDVMRGFEGDEGVNL